MPKEKTIKKKTCRYYSAGYVWVSNDGTVISYSYDSRTHYPKLKKTPQGRIYVEAAFGRVVSVALAVAACWCKPCPNDGKRYELSHKDGNIGNNDYRNLEWVPYHYAHTTEDSTTIYYGGLDVVVGKDGKTVTVEGKPVYTSDNLYNSDVDLFHFIGPHAVLYTKHCSFNGEIVHMEELMTLAGYVVGDDADLSNPVVLHRDGNCLNCASDNLEFVEAMDPRYLDYLKKREETKNKRNQETNPGKKLPSGW